jgi:hypothetical protein
VLFEKPLEDLELSDETREILARSLIFQPVESVSRVVFISTPHGGSFLTRNPIADLVGALISIPANVQDRVAEVLRQDPDAVALESLDEMPTSVDNMTPGDPFLETLRSLPIAENVAVHSIVAASGADSRCPRVACGGGWSSCSCA